MGMSKVKEEEKLEKGTYLRRNKDVKKKGE